MKKLFKFFSLIFLLFATTATCLACDDFRLVGNLDVIKNLRKQIDPQKKEIGIEEGPCINYGNTIFMLDFENPGSVVISVPVLSSSVGKMIGEVVTPVKIHGTEAIDNALHYFTSNSDSFTLSYNQPKFLRIPSNDGGNKNLRHTSASYFASHLKGVTITASDRVYYMIKNQNLEDLRIIHERYDGVKTIFKFQPHFGIVKFTPDRKKPQPQKQQRPWSWLWSPRKKGDYTELVELTETVEKKKTD